MKTVIMTLLAACVLVAVAAPPKPMWPSAYKADFTVVVEGHSHEFTVSGTTYYDYSLQADRSDFPDFREPNTYDIVLNLYAQNKSYEFIQNDKSCVERNLTRPMFVPDFHWFSYQGQAVVNGIICDHWTHDSANQQYWDDSSNHLPVQFQNEHETFTYRNFETGPQDPTLFRKPYGSKCTPRP